MHTMMKAIASCRLLRNRWKLRGPTGIANPDKAIAWGRISARGSSSQYDKGIAPQVEGKARSTNRTGPRGLIRGFAHEEQVPPLPSSSKK